MDSLKKIISLAAKFEHKIAQRRSAQPSELEKALIDARVRPDANELAPFLDKAGLPANAKADIKIRIHPTQSVEFVTDPVRAGLNKILNEAYSTRMQKALQDAGVAPTQPMYVNLAKF